MDGSSIRGVGGSGHVHLLGLVPPLPAGGRALPTACTAHVLQAGSTARGLSFKLPLFRVCDAWFRNELASAHRALRPCGVRSVVEACGTQSRDRGGQSYGDPEVGIERDIASLLKSGALPQVPWEPVEDVHFAPCQE